MNAEVGVGAVVVEVEVEVEAELGLRLPLLLPDPDARASGTEPFEPVRPGIRTRGSVLSFEDARVGISGLGGGRCAGRE